VSAGDSVGDQTADDGDDDTDDDLCEPTLHVVTMPNPDGKTMKRRSDELRRPALSVDPFILRCDSRPSDRPQDTPSERPFLFAQSTNDSRRMDRRAARRARVGCAIKYLAERDGNA
jgi:hypothetical protein